MTTSLFLPTNVQYEWLEALDNFLIAKVCYDNNVELPSEWIVTKYSAFDFFCNALSYIFECSPAIEESDYSYSLTISEIKEWFQLQEKYPEMVKDELWIFGPVEELSSDFQFGGLQCKSTPIGIRLNSEGCDYFQVVEKFISLKERLLHKLTVWREHDASLTNSKTGRDTYSVA
ncbi:hypothetical protein [Paenibacillus sp. IITD108]|uniref:hypothetical protein n=1 Tax=Paenibacillus sp. IITD108 TaxID=3116649 RepID=UPI002F42C4A2